MLNLLIYTPLTLVVFYGALKLHHKTKHPLLNPLLMSILFIILLLSFVPAAYQPYKNGTKIISFFLGPATVVLAIPMYKQLALLKAHFLPILLGVLTSVVTSFSVVILIARVCRLHSDLILSLLPKSITTPIGISLSEQLGGVPPITVVSIIITGILGAIVSPWIIETFNINHPISKGIGIGASSHVVGTTKAIELGEVEGAMSSLSIALTGVLTFVCVPLLMQLVHFLHIL